MNGRRILFGFVLAVVFLGAFTLVAQTSEKPAGSGMSAMTMSEKSPAMDCQAVMKEQKAMMARMDEMDARLQKLADKMNEARGSKKVDAMAAVVKELITQRKQMRDEMAKMQPMMMHHMMQHMQAGMMHAMAECPMMSEK